MNIESPDITELTDLIAELCGVYLDDSKGYLLDSRLKKIAARLDCATAAEFVARARRSENRELRQEIIDAITTNETLFFRDDSPFKALRYKILPETIDRVYRNNMPRRLRIWSAACSTGQEAYSLAMVLHDVVPDIGTWDIQILATDISHSALEVAKRGWYSELEVSRGLDDASQSNYFTKDGAGWQVSNDLKRVVRFETRNLLAPILERSHFDVVFCRNVAIYFRKDQRDDLFRRIVQTLAPDGYLFVGSSESLSDLGQAFSPQTHCNCTVYQPRPGKCQVNSA